MDDCEPKKRRAKSRKTTTDEESEKLASDLVTANELYKKFEFDSALGLLSKLEKKAKKLEDSESLEQCTLLEAEIYVLLDNYEQALKCLVNCPFNISAVKILSKIALSNNKSRDNVEILKIVSELLGTCLSQGSSRDDPMPPECTVLFLDCLTRLRKAADLKQCVRNLTENFFYDYQDGVGYLQNVLSRLRPMLAAANSIPEKIAIPASPSPARGTPYVTLFNTRALGPDAETNRDAFCNMLTISQEALINDRVMRTGNCSLHVMLLEYFDLLNDMVSYDKNLSAPYLRIDQGENPMHRPEYEVGSGIINVVKTRTKRSSKRRPNVSSIENGLDSGTPIREPQTLAKNHPLQTAYLSLKRSWTLPWKSVLSHCNDQNVRQRLLYALSQKSLWSMDELGMVMLEVICKYQHLLLGSHEKYTICLCFLLYALCEIISAKDDETMASGGCLFLSDDIRDARLLKATAPMNKRINELLSNSGTKLLALIFDTMKSTPGILRDIGSPLLINEPHEFLHHMFKNISSMILLECIPKGRLSSQDIIRRARVAFIIGKYILWHHFPKKQNFVTQRNLRHYNAVREIVQCLHSLMVLGHSTVLREASRNVHLRLNLRFRDTHLNFHNSLTSGSLALGIKSIERRYLHLQNQLQKHSVKI